MKAPLIGIMADSHGQPETIEAALAMLKNRGCRSIYHLGDICDSAHPETAGDCLRPLQANGVIAIKGNNDHAIVANHKGSDNTSVSPDILRYLHRLPLIKQYRNAFFVHSLPFVRELGLSSMIGTMGQNESQRFFREQPAHIVFRGHSHSPEITWPVNQRIEARTPAVGEKFNLSQKIPCIVTCGALTRGLCMAWNAEENVVDCLSFK
jgi:predicted phosphodiesterase